jgi:hypothetical protein
VALICDRCTRISGPLVDYGRMTGKPEVIRTWLVGRAGNLKIHFTD